MTDTNIDERSQQGKGDVPCPRIATYRHSSGPSLGQFLARYVVVGRVRLGGTLVERDEFLPMIFIGHSEDSVIGEAQAWWAQEQRKLQARNASLIKARQSRTGRGKAAVA